MRIAALTQGRNIPAARFRVRQHIPQLKNLGIDVKEFFPAINAYASVPFGIHRWPRYARLPAVAAWQALKVGLRAPHVYEAQRHHITWLQRELLPGYLTLEQKLKSPVVFDVDDAIWLAKTGAASYVSKLASHATAIIAGNNYIADWFSAFNGNVAVIPTAVDIHRFTPAQNAQREEFTIGWIGTASNLKYLMEIAPALAAFLRRHADSILLVVSDQALNMQGLPENQVRYLAWSGSVEVEAIRKMTIGIMPLPDDEWAKGKCSFKMLQYMACGIPVVVSPVGMNATVLRLDKVGLGAATIDEWIDAFEYLYQDPAGAQHMGEQGRHVVMKNFSTDVISWMIAEVFKSIA